MPALEGAMLRVLYAGVPVVAQLVVCVLLGVVFGGVGRHVSVLVSGFGFLFGFIAV